MDDLTLEYMRGGEFFESEIFDFSGDCEAGGSLLERAHRKAESLVKDYESPVPGRIREGLERYFHNEYRKLG